MSTEHDTYRRLYLETLALCRKLESGVVGRGRERDLGDPAQVTMSLLEMMTGGQVAAPPAQTEAVRAHERTKPTGRCSPLAQLLDRPSTS